MLDYTEAQLSISLVEARNDKAHEYLYVHLPDRTLVYDATASRELQAPVWLVMTTAITGFSQYRARSFVWAYNKWLIADPQSTALGTFSDTNGAHWGVDVRWEFGTAIVYNSGMGAVFHDLELVALTGRVDADTVISTSWSYDGIDYTADAPIATGGPGNFQKRLCWRRQGKMRNWRIQKFTGDSRAHLSFARLEARIEPLMF